MNDKVKKPEVSAAVTEMAAKIAEGIKIDAKALKDGVAKATTDENTYVNVLPEGLTKEVVQQVHDHNAVFIAAAGKAFGDASIAAMKKHADIDQVKGEFTTVGKDSIGFNMGRSKTVLVKPGDKSAGTKEIYGSLSAKVSLSGIENKGEFSEVKAMLAAKATKQLSGE